MTLMERRKQELAALAAQHVAGLLVPREVVEYARDPETALHSHFEWDDTKAGEAFRIHQARELIRVVVEVRPSKHGPDEAPLYVSVMDDRKRDGGGYRPIASVLADTVLREQMLSTAKLELAAFRNRYRKLSELSEVIAVIDRVVGGDEAGGLSPDRPAPPEQPRTRVHGEPDGVTLVPAE